MKIHEIGMGDLTTPDIDEGISMKYTCTWIFMDVSDNIFWSLWLSMDFHGVYDVHSGIFMKLEWVINLIAQSIADKINKLNNGWEILKLH